MVQTSVRDELLIAKAGMGGDLTPKEDRSYVNASYQKQTVTIDAGDLATTATVNSSAYTFDKKTVTVTAVNLATVATVNGSAYEANAAVATATKTEIATELVALINAGETLSTAELSGETVIVTAVGTSTQTVVGTTNCSVAQTVVAEAAIATGLAAIINTNEGDEVTASADSGIVTIIADEIDTTFTVVGTTNCTVARVTDAPGYIGFGVLVCIDPADNGKCKKPAIAADVTSTRAIGFTNCDESKTEDGYDTGQVVSVRKKGTIWVQAEEAVSPGDTVYARYTSSGTNTTLGAIRNDADSSTAGALTGCEILDYDSTTELALISINRP